MYHTTIWSNSKGLFFLYYDEETTEAMKVFMAPADI
jgi:hypothetical protein